MIEGPPKKIQFKRTEGSHTGSDSAVFEESYDFIAQSLNRSLEQQFGDDVEAKRAYLESFQAQLDNRLADFEQRLPSGTTAWRRAKEGDQSARSNIKIIRSEIVSDS